MIMITVMAAMEIPLHAFSWKFKEIPPGIYGKVAVQKQHEQVSR
jgi:hypothetical protein